MFDKNKDQEFKLKKVDETRDCFFEEIKKIQLMRKKVKDLHSFRLY